MPKWTDYTIKTTVADNNEIMTLDTAGKANKRLSLSTLSDWVLGKIADKVFDKLQTNDKTILGAINELNSKILNAGFNKDTNFFASSFYKSKNINDGVLITGITILPFTWSGYSTFGISNINTELSVACFYNLSVAKTIPYSVDQKRGMVLINANANDIIIFYGKLIHN